MITTLDRRLAELAHLGQRNISADDITIDGLLAVDGSHAANGAQSAIGSHFRKWNQRGLIVRTGRVTRSRAPHRKGGMIQIWEITDAGVLWARSVRES